MSKLATLGTINACYQMCSFKDRLFIKIRYLTCPFDLLTRKIEGKGSILDIGCGHGLFLNLIKETYPAIRCVGYDHDERKIAVARDSLVKEDLTFLHSTELKRLKKHSFDCVSLIDVLYSIPEESWHSILTTAYDYLKPGGVLLIKETINSPVFKYYICKLQETLAIHILKYTKGSDLVLPHWSFFHKMIKKAGFTAFQHQRVDRFYPWPHHLFTAMKPSKKLNTK